MRVIVVQNRIKARGRKRIGVVAVKLGECPCERIAAHFCRAAPVCGVAKLPDDEVVERPQRKEDDREGNNRRSHGKSGVCAGLHDGENR